MATRHDQQEGWIPEDVSRRNIALHRFLKRHFKMGLQHLKALKIGLISFGLLGFGAFAIQNGASPGPVFWVLAAAIVVLNGIEISEFFAVWAELQEIDRQDAASDTDEDEEE